MLYDEHVAVHVFNEMLEEALRHPPVLIPYEAYRLVYIPSYLLPGEYILHIAVIFPRPDGVLQLQPATQLRAFHQLRHLQLHIHIQSHIYDNIKRTHTYTCIRMCH